MSTSTGKAPGVNGKRAISGSNIDIYLRIESEAGTLVWHAERHSLFLFALETPFVSS